MTSIAATEGASPDSSGAGLFYALEERVVRPQKRWLLIDAFFYFLLLLPMLLGLILVPFGQIARLGYVLGVWRRSAREELAKSGDGDEVAGPALARSLNRLILAVALTPLLAIIPLFLLGLPELLGDLHAYSSTPEARANRQLEYLVGLTFSYVYVRAIIYLGRCWILGSLAGLTSFLPFLAYAILSFWVEGAGAGFPKWFLPHMLTGGRWLVINIAFLILLEFLIQRLRSTYQYRLLKTLHA